MQPSSAADVLSDMHRRPPVWIRIVVLSGALACLALTMCHGERSAQRAAAQRASSTAPTPQHPTTPTTALTAPTTLTTAPTAPTAPTTALTAPTTHTAAPTAPTAPEKSEGVPVQALEEGTMGKQPPRYFSASKAPGSLR